MSEDELRKRIERSLAFDGGDVWVYGHPPSFGWPGDYVFDLRACRTRLLDLFPPADDGEPADRDWMVRRGWVWSDFLNFEFIVHRLELEDSPPEHTTVYLEMIGGYFQILSDTGDSPQLKCDCRTRGDIRRIEKMFHLPVKEC